MAIRPVFVPTDSSTRPVEVIECHFEWSPGLAATQKKKNVVALHGAAKKMGIAPVLEVSSKSGEEIGRRLSAFSLKLQVGTNIFALESVYQGSKKFENGGPHIHWYAIPPREAKRSAKNEALGRLSGFEFDGRLFPLVPPSAFYDWLYIRALFPHAEWISDHLSYAGYSDIEFNPKKSLSCQARTVALYVWLNRRGLLRECVDDFDALTDYLPHI